MEHNNSDLNDLLTTLFPPRGTCAICQKPVLKRAMEFHLGGCLHQQNSQSTGKASPKFLILVEGKSNPGHYWLSLEVTQQSKLARLDQFLRTIWLECCGHLSAFTIGDTRYCIDAGMGEEWEEESLIDEQAMDIPTRRVLEPGQQCDYEYDYGSTTFLSIQVIAAYTGVAGGPSVRLLARNDPPRVWCQSCGRAATLVCTLCLDDRHFGQEGWFCQKCANKHACGRDMMLPVVNSPRTGVCGYTG